MKNELNKLKEELLNIQITIMQLRIKCGSDSELLSGQMLSVDQSISSAISSLKRAIEACEK